MTCQDTFDIRWARPVDAAEIARLFLMSSDGLAAYIWSRHAREGEPVEAVGAARYARTGTAFSYENCLLATRGDEVLGMIHAFEMPEPDSEAASPDRVLAPYAELEDPGSLYISGLAVHAPFREHGIGGTLLDYVEALALTRALPRLSLICFEQNVPARDFYLRRGFAVADRRPIVPHPCLHYTKGDALLMVRPLMDAADTPEIRLPETAVQHAG
ncbi:GNAT family N-acetyltransferase [Roseovarius sp.]|uniref:GNAT family N-acetyltransferase n=1 Tax=Roseovarius sp. TaxID=1486281 RepID=UPI002612FEBE|nr:GNAT family N-acetyltransferase [Roseovarius sp.]MDM8166709.1 GNAT family N-acetyltransferase [Roseovarius sp.]